MTGWEEPALSVKLLGEMVTPDGRLPAETEIEPVKLLPAVADTVTGKDWPADNRKRRGIGQLPFMPRMRDWIQGFNKGSGS